MQNKVFEVNISDEPDLICKLLEADLTSSADVLGGKCEANVCLGWSQYPEFLVYTFFIHTTVFILFYYFSPLQANFFEVLMFLHNICLTGTPLCVSNTCMVFEYFSTAAGV